MTKVTKPMSEDTLNWIHSFFQRTSIPRMSQDKRDRIVAEHYAGRMHEPTVPIEKKANKEAAS